MVKLMVILKSEGLFLKDAVQWIIHLWSSEMIFLIFLRLRIKRRRTGWLTGTIIALGVTLEPCWLSITMLLNHAHLYFPGSWALLWLVRRVDHWKGWRWLRQQKMEEQVGTAQMTSLDQVGKPRAALHLSTHVQCYTSRTTCKMKMRQCIFVFYYIWTATSLI